MDLCEKIRGNMLKFVELTFDFKVFDFKDQLE